MINESSLLEPVLLNYKCPLCGGNVYTENNPSDDLTMGEYCDNDNCNWFTNQFISYEELYG